jgi:hypothetical protein
MKHLLEGFTIDSVSHSCAILIETGICQESSPDPFLRVRVNGTKGQTTLLFVRTSELSPYQDDPDSLPNRLRNEKIAPRIEKIALKNGFIAPRNEKNKADDFVSEGVFRPGKVYSGVA